MKIHNWHTLAVLSNFAFFSLMIAFIYISKFDNSFDFEDQILLIWYRVGAILAVQIGWNLLLHSIPKLFPIPNKEGK